ncbi:MAG: hypothetical protein IJK41_05865 [Muribaculaceae bacterium]|nr:hypothetical protein [Muribaculaceae bacterium]
MKQFNQLIADTLKSAERVLEMAVKYNLQDSPDYLDYQDKLNGFSVAYLAPDPKK